MTIEIMKPHIWQIPSMW